MEEYERFLDRITSFAKKDFLFERKVFQTNLSVFNKVDSKNHFRKYYGDTTIFDLNENYKDRISSIIEKLYEAVPECFCERLNKATFHVTLHDLSSNMEYESIKEQLEKNENKIKEILKTVKILPNTIKMKTHCITNILNISLVLVLLPVNEIEYVKLMTIYHFIDEVKELNYKFTPHITLGYYNINGFDVSSAIKLEKLVREFNQNELEIDINTKNLFYEHFTSMNNYEKICRLS